jgi:predicted TIM-barrel fold metal-dependent hydrolase
VDPIVLEVLLQVGVDRMIFSTDRPHQSMTEATTFLAGLALTPHDHERIAQGNVEREMDVWMSAHLTSSRSTPTAPQVAPASQ